MTTETTTGTETKQLWTYTGIWGLRDGGEGAMWLTEDGRELTYVVKPKMKKTYRLFRIGSTYEVTTEVKGDSTSYFPSGEKGPVYKGPFADREKVARWQANEVTRRSTAEARKMATEERSSELDRAIEVLRSAYRALPFDQKPAFEVFVLKRLGGRN